MASRYVTQIKRKHGIVIQGGQSRPLPEGGVEPPQVPPEMEAAIKAALYEELYQKGIDLVFLNEPHCDTECYRQAAKLEAAQHGMEKTYGLAPGRKLTTRKSVAAKAVITKHSKDFNGTLNDSEVFNCGISRNTYHRYKRQLKAEQ